MLRATDTREAKACTRCGFVRVVTVTDFGGDYGLRWSRRCGACDLIYRAEIHEDTARTFRARAGGILAKRRAKKAK